MARNVWYVKSTELTHSRPCEYQVPAELTIHVVLSDPEGVRHVAEGQTSVGLQQLQKTFYAYLLCFNVF